MDNNCVNLPVFKGCTSKLWSIWWDDALGKLNIVALLFSINRLNPYMQIPLAIMSVNINCLMNSVRDLPFSYNFFLAEPTGTLLWFSSIKWLLKTNDAGLGTFASEKPEGLFFCFFYCYTFRIELYSIWLYQLSSYVLRCSNISKISFVHYLNLLTFLHYNFV